MLFELAGLIYEAGPAASAGGVDALGGCSWSVSGPALHTIPVTDRLGVVIVAALTRRTWERAMRAWSSSSACLQELGSANSLMRLIRITLQALVVALSVGTASANNGLNFIGAGIESFAMGGAFLGVARDPMALSTNPAGLAWQRSLSIEQEIAAAHEINIGFHDSLNPEQTVRNVWAPVANGGMTIPLSIAGVPVTLGNGLFVAGGSGGVFKNVATPFGTTDELAAVFGIAKASFGGAVAINDRLSAGVGVSLYYAQLTQKVFPGTSAIDALNPTHSFFGTNLRNANTFAGGVRLGLQFRANDRMTLGAIYNSKVALNLKGNSITADESSIGLGAVTYHDVHVNGLAEPQEIGAGIAYRLTPRLLIALDLKWLDWSQALRSSTLVASNPDNPAAPTKLSTTTAMNWRNQYAIALGTAFDLTPSSMLWVGYNYGRNPVPAATLNPLLARGIAFGIPLTD
jgi:long-chain fatty acid transport protein